MVNLFGSFVMWPPMYSNHISIISLRVHVKWSLDAATLLFYWNRVMTTEVSCSHLFQVTDRSYCSASYAQNSVIVIFLSWVSPSYPGSVSPYTAEPRPKTQFIHAVSGPVYTLQNHDLKHHWLHFSISVSAFSSNWRNLLLHWLQVSYKWSSRQCWALYRCMSRVECIKPCDANQNLQISTGIWQ